MRKPSPNQLRRLIFVLLKHPKQVLLTLVLAGVFGGLWYGYEVSIARPAMAFMGVPHETSAPAKYWSNHILRNEAYLVGYSEKLANPLWVTYKVTQIHQPFGKRPNFRSDWRSPFGVSPEDYTGTGYDRGHNAPNYVIASRYGSKAQQETFLMTNISPQRPSLNQKTWQRLEEVSADFFSKKYPEFWVVTGPIFDADPSQIKTLKGGRVAIPKAFYKIFIRPSMVDENPQGDTPYQVLAMVLPQNAKTTASLTQFVSTVDEIEAQTGLDFFWQLPDNIENRLEAANNAQAWALLEVANQKNRY